MKESIHMPHFEAGTPQPHMALGPEAGQPTGYDPRAHHVGEAAVRFGAGKIVDGVEYSKDGFTTMAAADRWLSGVADEVRGTLDHELAAGTVLADYAEAHGVSTDDVHPDALDSWVSGGGYARYQEHREFTRAQREADARVGVNTRPNGAAKDERYRRGLILQLPPYNRP